MAIVDFILNLAGILLWLNWRAEKFDPIGRRKPATLIGTLRQAGPQKFRRWHLPAILAALIFFRAIFYWQIGPALHWAGQLDLSVFTLSFRSDWFERILLFSILSFALTLGIFYLWLLLLSILKGPKPVHDFVRMQLGRIDNWPRGIKIFLPLIVTAVCWLAMSWLLAQMQIIPPLISAAQRLEESLLIALQSYLVWKFLIGALLALHLLNSYIYFGRHPVWNYVNATAQTLLSPLKKIPLRVGKVDFAPVVGIALIFLAAEFAGRGLRFLYARLPF